jgi:hypothetical protein
MIAGFTDEKLKRGYRRYCLSLTGENSHVFELALGQGSLSIGTKGISEGEFDIWVDPGAPINWDALNGHYTGHGAMHKEQYPYGDWPRWIYYSGADIGFAVWTSKRRTEDFYWMPTENACVDLEKAMIYHLSLDLKKKVKVTVGPEISELILNGDPTNLEIKVNGGNPGVDFEMNGYSHQGKTYGIPDIKDLQDVESLCVRVSPLGDPFDIESLKQFRNLKTLQLVGNICNANTLAELKGLESLSFFSVPDLTNLPQLKCWKHLNSFMGVDIDETVGKDIKKQLKTLKKERKIESIVSGLRSKTWFATEYENPFKHWEGKRGKKASKLYSAFLKEIKKAPDEETVQGCIIQFVEAFNTFDDIETVEREGIWDAVRKLGMASQLEITRDTLMQWFDEAREY